MAEPETLTENQSFSNDTYAHTWPSQQISRTRPTRHSPSSQCPSGAGSGRSRDSCTNRLTAHSGRPPRAPGAPCSWLAQAPRSLALSHLISFSSKRGGRSEGRHRGGIAWQGMSVGRVCPEAFLQGPPAEAAHLKPIRIRQECGGPLQCSLTRDQERSGHAVQAVALKSAGQQPGHPI